MALSDADALKLLARVAVLHHVVDLMFRETAISAGKSADDVSKFAETVKQFFEKNIPPGSTEMHINAEVDLLFQQIAADIRNLGSP